MLHSKQFVTILTIAGWLMLGLVMIGWMSWALWGPNREEDLPAGDPLNVATMQKALEQIDEDELTSNVPTVTLNLEADSASDSAETTDLDEGR